MFEKMILVGSTLQLFPSWMLRGNSHENRRRRNGYSKGGRKSKESRSGRTGMKRFIDRRRLEIQTFLFPSCFPIPGPKIFVNNLWGSRVD
jgi:hypothetical protein